MWLIELAAAEPVVVVVADLNGAVDFQKTGGIALVRSAKMEGKAMLLNCWYAWEFITPITMVSEFDQPLSIPPPAYEVS
jgi:hypothetical protein